MVTNFSIRVFTVCPGPKVPLLIVGRPDLCPRKMNFNPCGNNEYRNQHALPCRLILSLVLSFALSLRTTNYSINKQIISDGINVQADLFQHAIMCLPMQCQLFIGLQCMTMNAKSSPLFLHNMHLHSMIKSQIIW